MPISPFDLPGAQFLQLFLLLFTLAVVASLVIPAWLRPAGDAARVGDVDELAYLAGGTRRFVDTVVGRLLARGALATDGANELVVHAREAGATAAERGVLGMSGALRLAAIERMLEPHGGAIEKRLVAAGLLIDAGTTRWIRFWQTSPLLALIGFGAIKWAVGVGRDRPVGILSALLLAAALLALLRWRVIDRRTSAGQAVLRDEQARADRLRRAPLATETDRAVALFGTAVLAGSAYAALHTMRRPSGGDGSSSDGGCGDGGAGDGGSGCGGGGCGGCGS